MGLPDDVLGSAIPDWNLVKPLMVGLAALLRARTVGGDFRNLLGEAEASPQIPSSAEPMGLAVASQPQGGLPGGLGSLLQRFQQNGYGDLINSWIESGQNQPIAPDQLHGALGPGAVSNLSRLTGLSQDQLLSQLARVLPDVVDRLTPHGRMPDQAAMSR